MKNFLKRTIAAVALSAVAFFSVNSAQAGGSLTEPYKPQIWKGFYFGGHLGLAMAEADVSLAGIDIIGFDDDAFAGGIHVGYNWQRGNIVYGVEVDYTWTGADAEVLDYEIASLDGLGSVRGRLGYAINDLLLYTTAGFAWKDVDVVGDVIDLDETGYVIGAGAEWKFGHKYSLKAEALHYRFEDDVDGTRGLVEIDTDVTVVRTGLSIHF